MNWRVTAAAAAGLVLVLGACADQATRPTAPGEIAGPHLSFTTNEIRDQINALIPTPSDRGTVQGEFADVNSARNSGNQALLTTELAQFEAALLAILARYQNDNSLLTPYPGLNAEQSVLQLLQNVWIFAGRVYPLPMPTNNGEDVVEFTPGSNDEVRSQSRRAAMIIPNDAFDGPALVTISVATNQSNFTPPNNYVVHGLIYDYKASPKPKSGAQISIMFCVDDLPADGSGDWQVFHEQTSPLQIIKLPLGTTSDCPGGTHTVLMGGNSLLARGVNNVGTFLSSVFGPNVAYAAHGGLAGHTGGLDPFSRFAVGKKEFTVSAVQVASPTTYNGTTNELNFRRQNTTWDFSVTMLRNGGAYPCTSASALTASMTRTGNVTTNATSVTCDGSNFRIVFNNPTRPQATSGWISISVEGILAKPARTINFKSS